MTQFFDQEQDSDSLLGEFYFASGDTYFDEESDDLVWKDILREGEWAYRPGKKGPVAIPLRVLSGHADRQEDIGMQDLIDAFNEGALDHVTVPENHEDKAHENTGYVRQLKIVERDGKKFLRAGIDFTEPDIKERAIRGSIPNTSAGIMFDYIKKDTGKLFKRVLGHVALTGKPWINGMQPFSEVPEDTDIVVAEEVDEEIYFDDEFIDYLDFDAKLVPNKAGVKNWVEKHGGLPKAIADMAGDLISERRMSVSRAIATAVSRAKVLCAKGNQKYCAAIAQWNKMRAAAKADMSELTEAFGRSNLSDEERADIIKRADALGRTDLLPTEWEVDSSEDSANKNGAEDNSHKPEGGTEMAEVKNEDTTGDTPSTESGDSAPVELSEEQRKTLFAEWETKQAEKVAEEAAEKAELKSKVHVMEVDKRIGELSSEGYAEYPGFLSEVRNLMLADDGSASLTLSEEVDGETKEVSVSVTGAVERLLSALPKKDGSPDLGEQLNASENHSKPDTKTEELSEEERIEKAAEFLSVELPEKDGDA